MPSANTSRARRKKAARRRRIQTAVGVVGVLCAGVAAVLLWPGPDPQKRDRTIIAVDCTYSVRKVLPEWTQEFEQLVDRELAEGQSVDAGCFAGPRGTLTLAVKGLRAPSIQVAAGPRKACEAREALVRRSARQLRATVIATNRQVVADNVRGTNWLGALQYAADAEDVSRIVLFSDLVQQTGDVFISKATTDADVVPAPTNVSCASRT